MFDTVESLSRRLDADQANIIVHEVGEQTDRIRTTTDTGDRRVRETSQLLEDLRPCLPADHALEFADHRRKGMWSCGRAQQVVRRLEARGPVTEGFVDRVLERPAAAFYRHDLCAHQLHSEDVELLPLDVLRAHVDHGLKAE